MTIEGKTGVTMSDLSGETTMVVCASRGLGHGIATAFAEAGAPVLVGISGAALGISFTTVMPQCAPLTGVGRTAVRAR